jgi:hypothetical protein
MVFSSMAFNTFVGRNVVGESFFDLFRRRDSMLLTQQAWGTRISPPLGIGMFLIDGKTPSAVQVMSVYADLNSIERGLQYYEAIIVTDVGDATFKKST